MVTRRWVWAVPVGVVVLGSVTQARAAVVEPSKSGWWTAAAVAGTTLVPPDVPADGLLVQGGPNGPQASAALSFTVPANGTASRLVLRVAPSTATVPTSSVKVCPLTADFAPAQGGDAASAPTYDCTSSVTAPLSADGSSITLDVAALVRNETLALAVLPATTTDRVVLQGAAGSSLEVAAPTSSSTDYAPLPTQTPQVPEAPAVVAVSPVLGVVPSTAIPSLAAIPNPTPALAAASVPLEPQLTAAPQSPARGGLPRGWLALGLALMVAVLWRVAGSTALDDDMAPDGEPS